MIRSMRLRSVVGIFFAGISTFSPKPVLASAWSPWDGLMEQGTRASAIQGLCASLKSGYAGWELKKQTLISEGYAMHPPVNDGPVANGEAICSDAIARERKILDPQDRSKLVIARFNLAFEDRVQRLGARFRDSHLRLKTINPRTPIHLGLTLRELGGKFYVRSVTGLLQARLTKTGQPVPKRGDEVVEISGLPIERARAELLPYLSGSSERAAREFAVEALTSRQFRYPETAKSRLQWKDASGAAQSAELTWLYGFSAANNSIPLQQDDVTYLQSIGAVELSSAVEAPKSSELALLAAIKRMTAPTEPLDETEREISLEGHLTGTTRVYDSRGEVSALAGVYAQKFMVIQIRGFMDWAVSKSVPQLASADASGDRVTLAHFLVSWLQAAEKLSLPIVLDLRNNPGGNAYYANALVSAFLAQGESALPYTEAFPLTSRNRAGIFQTFLPRPGMSDIDAGFENGFGQAFGARFASEQAQQYFMTPLFRRARIESAKLLKVPPRIIVWTGVNCISACEIASMMLAARPNVTMLGSALNGTGMGQIMSPMESAAASAAEPNGLFTSSMFPNYYFGAPEAEKMDATGLDGEARIEKRAKRIAENRPLKPARVYEEQLIDLKQNGLGWIQATERLLTPSPMSL